MPAFTKVFQKITFSSIWQEDYATRVLWISMLVHQNERHIVMANINGLSRIANMPEPEVEKSLAKLTSPDPKAPNQEFQGRRVEKIKDDEWFILNGEKYRDLMSAAERAEYNRQRQQRYRDRKAAKNATAYCCPTPSDTAPVDKSVAIQRPPGFPKDEAEAIAIGQMIGVDQEVASREYNKLDAVGFVDRSGRPVVNFRSYLKMADSYERNRQAEQKARGNGAPGSKSLGTADRIGLENQLKRLQESKIKLKGEAEFYGPDAERDKKIKETAAKIQSIEATLDTIQP